MMLKRKVYDKLLEWKESSNGKTAILIDGARRVGKSFVAREFGKNEYKSYILIDFAIIPQEIKDLFVYDIGDLDIFFQKLSLYYSTILYNRESLIIFDEIQQFPLARQLIKYLVADGRYDYIETGSLIRLKKNVQDIVIPSEEEHIEMYPMDFEEFLWALGDITTIPILFNFFEKKKPLGDVLHRKIMNLFKQYILVGGMPQAVLAYLPEKSFEEADKAKRTIINLYIEKMLVSSRKVMKIEYLLYSIIFRISFLKKKKNSKYLH